MKQATRVSITIRNTRLGGLYGDFRRCLNWNILNRFKSPLMLAADAVSFCLFCHAVAFHTNHLGALVDCLQACLLTLFRKGSRTPSLLPSLRSCSRCLSAP